MYLPSDDRKPPMTSQFALRVAILSGIALVAFSVIFFRLWYLEVLSSEKYVEAAENNRIREVTIQAPRGAIRDRDGKVLVENRTALALQVRPDRLPGERRERNKVIERLADIAEMNASKVREQIRRQTRELPSNPVTLKRDVDYELVYFLREYQEKFPGVTAERVFVREYRKGTLGAHLFGYVAEVTAEQLEEPRYRSLDPGDLVGQAGIESAYDHALRGRNGAVRIQVDALGRPRGRRLSERPPRAGNDLRLTLDAKVQAAGEAAIGRFGLPAAFAVMDVDDGSILGLGSAPTFDPSIFTRPNLKPEVFEQLTSEEQDSPLSNRAIQGLYPTGSTFKLLTATASLEEGLITPSTAVHDGGSINVGGITFENAGGAAYGTLAMPQALQVSSDVFFYKLGIASDEAGEEAIQKWAADLGIGRPTGIDLPAEVEGLLPTPEWRNRLYEKGDTDRPWSVGDAINLSVGQGDLQTNPLQMAIAYATVANGGKVVRPHLGDRVEDPAGRMVSEINPGPRRQLDIDPATRDTILDGLRAAAMEGGGTSYGVFGGFPVQVAGKTGTAERFGHADQSWYIALAPAQDPEIVVAVTVEEGGFGADSAAPAAKEILGEYFPNVRDRDVQASEAEAQAEGAYD